jgi:predicted NBD/HSP70 family sugar kinase
MHIPGWEGFALAARCEAHFGVPAVIANDADAAGLPNTALVPGKVASTCSI